MRLPIHDLEEAIIREARSAGRLILQAPTGSGKSTQVPQMLLDGGLLGAGEAVVLQPRRLPARMLAARVAQERGCKLGEEVGYQIRLDRVVSEKTRIRYVTEGILLRQMEGDLALRGVSAILFDEFHERHLYGDITLARALDLQENLRPDLKIIVMSATLDAGLLEKYLGDCAVLKSEGRNYPVEIAYLPKPARFDEYPVWELAADELERAARAQEGDALVFMPGAYEIGRTIQAVRASSLDCVVLPLHGELPATEQDAALQPYGKRKVIVATNVAETSLTIDGVRLVIDSGLARIARYDPNRGLNTLLVEKISRASADQRAGRAGRTAPGTCLRLWTEREHAERPARELTEVMRLDLAEVVLTLKASGIRDMLGFRWLEPPGAKSLHRAEELLEELGALRGGEITAIGRRMLAFPIHPRYARMFLAADELGCVRAIASIAALSQGRPLLRRGESKQASQEREDILGEEGSSDFFLLLRALRFAEKNNPQACGRLGINVVAAREAMQLSAQFLYIARGMKLEVDAERGVSDEGIQKSILAGFPDQVARRCEPGTLRCELVHGRKGVLARESAVRESELLVASEVREVQGKELQVLLTLATAIREEWLEELFPGAVEGRREVFYDSVHRKVVAIEEVVFRNLVVRSSQSGPPPLEEAAALLAEEVLAGNCPLKNWDNAVEQWITRVERLREWMPELGLPAVGEEGRREMIRQICHGATSYKEIKEIQVWGTVKGWLSPMQQEMVDRFAPERLDLPNGRKAKVAYAASGSPTVSIRIQDLYGVAESLFVADRRVQIVIHVLAPNHRPIQVTSNLATFWKEAYPKIKQELQRKYPKHEWR